MAGAMAFAPDRVLDYARGSRLWMWYLGRLFGITQETLGSTAVLRSVRVQGAIGLCFALLALYAWFRGPG